MSKRKNNKKTNNHQKIIDAPISKDHPEIKEENITADISSRKPTSATVTVQADCVIVSSLEYVTMRNENIQLRAKIEELNNHNSELLKLIGRKDDTIDELRKENEILKAMLKELREQNEELKKSNAEMKGKIDSLITENKKRDALSKLNDCDKLSNDAFKLEYRKYFKLRKHDYAPNLGDFVCNPPDDGDELIFWIQFCKYYPNSNNEKFRWIYEQINKNRVQCGAHYRVDNIDKSLFDSLMETAFPELYRDNKALCDEYREWLFLFHVSK